MFKMKLSPKVIVLFFLFNVVFLPHLFARDKAIVLSVIDSDTLRVRYKSNEERFKLVGITTPDTKLNSAVLDNAEKYEKDVNDILLIGKRTLEFTKSLVKPNDKVSIEFDIQFLDKDGRYLGYVYLEDGRMLNEEIIKAGFASPSAERLNVKYKKKFQKAFADARENRKGLWNPAESGK
ncbi:MAG: thermonuclease family protein [Candidatus Kuenenia stuttgartiensis]|nr:thermonuclease family protein [Planctomycetia bacterium]MBZ0193312.1 thermonuclease family protein [Candidatus Kuenenia stuttgartiensis]